MHQTRLAVPGRPSMSVRCGGLKEVHYPIDNKPRFCSMFSFQGSSKLVNLISNRSHFKSCRIPSFMLQNVHKVFYFDGRNNFFKLSSSFIVFLLSENGTQISGSMEGRKPMSMKASEAFLFLICISAVLDHEHK